MTYSNNRNNRKQSIWENLTDFSYNPADIGDWVKLGCQVMVVGSFIVLVKALDGETCGAGWSVWMPQTWGNPVGCFVRGLVRNVPDDFLDNRSTTPEVVEPPSEETGVVGSPD